MRFLEDVFGIHPLTAEDIITADTREKVEIYDGYLFLCMRGLGRNSDAIPILEGINVSIVLSTEFVIVCHEKPVFDIAMVIRRIEKLRGKLNITTDTMMYAIMDDMVDTFIPLVRSTEIEIDSIDELVLVLSESEQSDMLRRIWSARKRVTQLYRLLFAKSDVLKALTKRSSDFLKPDTLLYLRDILDHVIAMVQNLVHYEDILNRSHSNYLVQISIEINQVSNHMAKVMKKLPGWAGIIMPLTLISGIWGMNVGVPGQGKVEWFFGIVFAMCLVGLGLYWFGRKQDWF